MDIRGYEDRLILSKLYVFILYLTYCKDKMHLTDMYYKCFVCVYIF